MIRPAMIRGRSGVGSTLVEASVILVLFLVVLIGILDVGQVIFFHHVLTERVRAGARYAAVHTYDPSAIKNVVSYNSATAPSDGSSGLFGISPSMVQVNLYDQGTSDARVVVSISAFTLHFVSPWLMRDFTPTPISAAVPVESGGNAI